MYHIVQFYGRKDSRHRRDGDGVKIFKALCDEMERLGQTP
jgi:hypothetical protein